MASKSYAIRFVRFKYSGSFPPCMAKNEFVLGLRDHLRAIYGTNSHYTPGESDSEAVKKGPAYILQKKDPTRPTDISSFCLQKDLCKHPPATSSELATDIIEYARQDKDVNLTLDKNLMVAKIAGVEYIINAYIDGGYAGHISVNLFPVPKIY
jgi:hypothetical protein